MKLLEVKNLRTYFFREGRIIKAVDNISFDVNEDEILCIVGETGSGKSVTALSILRLIDKPGRIVSGKIIFRGKDILTMNEEELRGIRGKEISMIFQNPSSFLNPVISVGEQISEALREHLNLDKREAKERAIKLMKEAGIENPERRYNFYPHMLSGGMNQRIMISIAIACNPKLIIADEPTSNLDVVIENQIIELLIKIKKKMKCSIIFITHDLAIARRIADRVIVMRKGKIIEKGSSKKIFSKPENEYTKKLLSIFYEAS